MNIYYIIRNRPLFHGRAFQENTYRKVLVTSGEKHDYDKTNRNNKTSEQL